MATPEVIPLAQLLSPIPGESPSGSDLRHDPVRGEIRAACQGQDRDLLVENTSGPNWQQVISLSVSVLDQRSKDLEVAARLTAALVAVHGFAGLRDGLHLICGMLETFWDSVYPLPDDGDLEPRVGPFSLITDDTRGLRLPLLLRLVPILPGSAEYSWSFWNARMLVPKTQQESDEQFSARRATAAEQQRLFDEAAVSTSLAHIQNLYEDLTEAKLALQQFDTAIGLRFQAMAPGTSSLRKPIEDCEVLVRRILNDKGGLQRPEDGQQDSDSDTVLNGVSSRPGAGSSGPIRSREDAFRRLIEVATYLRQAEPQSPIPCLIDRAVAWGKMPFNELLREIIKDDGARNQVSELLGLAPASQKSTGDD